MKKTIHPTSRKSEKEAWEKKGILDRKPERAVQAKIRDKTKNLYTRQVENPKGRLGKKRVSRWIENPKGRSRQKLGN